MTINPFLAGVLATLLVEMAAFIIYAFIYTYKHK